VKEKRIGVILSGGLSRRFGHPKAFFHYQGKPMYQWALEAVRPHADEVVIISHPTLTERFKAETDLPIYEDVEPFQGLGPLAGIYTAMKKAEGAWYLITPCDTPFSTSALYSFLWEKCYSSEKDGVVPVRSGKPEMLLAIYSRRLMPLLETLLSDGALKVSNILEKAEIEIAQVDGLFSEKTFANINTPNDLNANG
jgi:molybdopterin-guanine dinucleotide biosynthesis protein A